MRKAASRSKVSAANPDGFADTDAESRQDLSDLPVGVRTVAGHDQCGQTMHHQPEVAESLAV